MPANFIETVEEFQDEYGARFVVLNIRYKKKKNPLKQMMIDGIEFVAETALAAYTFKSNFHPVVPMTFSLMGAASVADFCKNGRRYIRKLSRRQRDRLQLRVHLATGTLTYFTTIHVFSRALQSNSKVWIPSLGVAASSYYLAVSSLNRLGRVVFNRTPVMKCCQLLFGPTLIASAAYYLLSFRQHKEEWVLCLPMIVSALVANQISFTGYRRVESNNEPRWLLFKGLELFVGGCIILFNGLVLVTYATNNGFHPLFITFFTTMVINGITDITNSLDSFHGCVEMEAPVFYCICGMIAGPFIFLSAFLGVKYISHPIMYPAFFVTAGTGIALTGKSGMNLYDLVPRPVFRRYCRRVLGPAVTVLSTLAAAYVGRKVGWRFSLLGMPFIASGILDTYIGFGREDQP